MLIDENWVSGNDSELKSQYNIGYVSTNSKTDGSWRRLQVMCNQEGTEVRSRAGYYAPRM
jgi:hypothetical protein